MKIWLWMAIFHSVISFNYSHASTGDAAYSLVKGQIIKNDKNSREYMAKLYEINNRMKRVQKRRSSIDNKAINAEANVRQLAKNTTILEKTVDDQKEVLSRRLRALYILGEDKLLRAIFSANNSEDLQQALKYLKIFTEQDFHLLKSYQSNLKILSKKRMRLEKNVKSLISLRKKLKKQEEYLTKDQKRKKHYIRKLEKLNQSAFSKLSKIKKQLGVSEFALSFFELKGKLPAPISTELSKGYGMTEHPVYQYRLSHKGHYYRAQKPSKISSVAEGRVAYIGNLKGYGKTLVLDHGDNYYSVYSGLGKVEVGDGDKVQGASLLATNTSQLYFEIRHFSEAIDPQQWIQR